MKKNISNILMVSITLLLTTPFIIIIYSKSLNPRQVIILEIIAVVLILISYGVFCSVERRAYFRPTVFLLMFITTMFFVVNIDNLFKLSNDVFFNARKDKLNKLAAKINHNIKSEKFNSEEISKEMCMKYKNELPDVDCKDLKVYESNEIWFVVNKFEKHSYGFVYCEEKEPSPGFEGRKVSYTMIEQNWYSWSN